jgi:signal transduction histidine kinase
MNTSHIKKVTLFGTWCIHVLYTRLIKPKSTLRDDQRHEFILNIILSGLICLGAILLIDVTHQSIVQKDAYLGMSVVSFSGVCVFFVLLLVISRYGYYKISSYITIGFCLLFTTYSQYIWGASLPSALLSDAFIITLTTLLISRKAGIYMSFIIAVILATLTYKEGLTQSISPWKLQPITIWTGIQHAVILCTITILSWLYAKEIEKALTRALTSEKALQEKNDSLEQIVEERTQALKLAHIEKNLQMYRFVEFGKLSAGVFHDILNPLTVIALNMESLQSSSSQIPEIQNNIQQAIRASKRMERFISTVKKQIQVTDTALSFSLNNEIEEVILLFTHKANISYVQIHFHADTEIMYFGNPIKFHQIIANLISNAIDSYDNTNENKDKSVYIHISEHASHINITITDKGTGIPGTILQNIFEPFFTTKQKNGIGIGLSSTKHIIEKNFNGSIHVKSEVGFGTTFTVCIPTKPTTHEHSSYT